MLRHLTVRLGLVIAATLLVSGGALSALSANAGAATSSGSAPGVTSRQITVGDVATLTGPIASDFAAVVPGVRAYFDMVNAQGGIAGRKLDLAYVLDDGGNPTAFGNLARTLVDQDHVFAVVGVASAFFTPTFFDESGTPTYGYNATPNWSGPPNLFGAGGSTQLPAVVGPYTAWLLKRTHSTSVAVMAYNVQPSGSICGSTANELRKAGFDVSFQDLSAPIDGDMTTDVQRIQHAGSDFILSCMDVTGNISLARAVQQYGIKANQLWFNGSDQQVLASYATLMQRVYFSIPYVPLRAPTKRYPGLQGYLRAMRTYEPSYVGDQLATEGWQSAALFAAGVRAAGSNLTQQRVIRLTNQMTDFTADGFATVTDWSAAHHTANGPWCTGYVKVAGIHFEPVYPKGHQVFACFGSLDARNTTLVTPPVGTPGT